MNLEISKWGDHNIVWIDSDQLDRCIEVYRKKHLDGVGISPHKGFRGADVGFLREVPDVGGVVLSYAENIDLSALRVAENAQFLSVSGNKQPIDYEAFPRLRELRLEWHKKLLLPRRNQVLRLLYLRGFKPASQSLKELPRYTHLDRIELIQGNARSLSGVETFSELRSAEFSYMTKLEDIGGLTQNKRLESLLFEVCRKVNNFHALGKLRSLKSLCIHDCGTIPSIGFIREMPGLRDFRFVKTVVQDGDISPCLRLESVAFTASRHYSHTPEELKAAIAANAKA